MSPHDEICSRFGAYPQPSRRHCQLRYVSLDAARSVIGVNESGSVVVMISITGAQRGILLNPIGNNVWSGQSVQSLNSNAITWSLAKELYGPSGPYFIIPMGLFIGFAVTVVHWLINKVKDEVHRVLRSVLMPTGAALAIYRHRQGRPGDTAPCFPVFFCFGEPEAP